MKTAIKFIVAFLVSLSLFYFFVKEEGFEVVLTSVEFFFNFKGLVILLLTFFILLFGAIRWRMIIKTTGDSIPLITALRYHIKGFTVDYLTPFAFFGGETVRIFLLEKNIGLQKSAFASVTDKIIGITTHFLFFLAGIVLFLFYGLRQYNLLFFYALLSVIIISVLLFLFYFQALRKKSFLKLLFYFFGGLKKFFKNNKNGESIIAIEKRMLEFFSGSKKEFFKIVFISLIVNIFYFLRILVILYFITGSLNIVFVFIIYGLVFLSMFLPLPAAIGGMEIILGIGFGIIGIGIHYGIMMAIILRSADLFASVVGIVLFMKMSLFSFLKEFKLFLAK